MKFITLAALCLTLLFPVAHAESQDREKPIEIQANHFFGDELKQTATYSGSVRLDQGTLRLTGQKLILQETPSGYRKGTLTGHLATFRQKRDPKIKGVEEWISGQAEQIVYEEQTGIVTLTGQAVVERSENGIIKDRAKGNKIVYDTIRSRTIIQGSSGGRATTVIAPRNNKR
ncbi:MAG TPA: lipopolysaccharide transport periplasmic protein LptA [Candidatus Aphodousia faecigallinarum]|uniref:Lipopolysaccharide export system protein LptA n=1 Tax=Candidatus Aphodousia faecigallinarum TaxID=2840677 RepID=A0A9D1IJ71_9BURK|nr:lipopolysaccharide transport periplasmic protein LptA [Candidatus Aphodousia faecigallinarum]